MIDLEERFDRAWTGEPVHPAVERRLAAGRRTLRRRRIAVAGAALAAVVALGGTALATGGPRAPSDTSGVEVAQSGAELDRLSAGNNAAYAADGRIIVRPGWEVSQRIDEVYVGETAREAVGLEIRNTETHEREWYYLQWNLDDTGSINRSRPQSNPGMTLRDWLPWPDGTRARP